MPDFLSLVFADLLGVPGLSVSSGLVSFAVSA